MDHRRMPALGRVLWASGLAMLMIAGSIAGGRLGAPVGAQQSGSAWSPPRTVFVPETGQAIDGYFLDLWREGGGFYSFGNPITPEITLDNGHVVQYYQYARFEYWPEGDGSGNIVFLADVGEELRPIVLRRWSPIGSLDAKDARTTQSRTTGAATELVAVTRAWLPLPADAGAETSANWRYVPETGHSIANGFKAFWEATGEASYLGNPLTEEYTLGGVVYQVFERGQLAWEEGADPYMVPVGRKLAERYGIDTSPVAQGDIPTYTEDLFIPPPPPESSLGQSPVRGVPGAAKTIVVSIGQQTLWALEGDEVVLSTLVSTGREEFDTPLGQFSIINKLPVQDMEGVIGGEYYNVPQVPDVMYFTDVGHAIHGTYWHDNFGQVMSHGCVNVPMGTSLWLYDWTPMGTPLLVVE